MNPPSRRGAWPRWARWLRDILLILLLFAGLQWWQARDLRQGPAPALSGTDIHGHAQSLAQYRGQPVLVHFWATWCPICRMEEDAIDGLSADFPVITVATTSGSPAELAGYMQREGLGFPVVVDESGDLARQWGVVGVPTTYILDPKGNIAWAGQGYSTGLGLRIRLMLAD